MAPCVWLITGASTGFGRCLTESLLRRGERVVATARDVSKLAGLPSNGRLLTACLDVTAPATIAAAVGLPYAASAALTCS